MRTDLAVVGAVLAAAGAAVSLSPALGGGLSAAVTPTLLAALGVVVAVAGVAGASLGEQSVDAERERDDTDGAAPGDPLGAEFDATLARIERMSSTELRRSDGPDEIRRGLREAAIATVVRRAGVDRETAATRVDSGEWTDDPVAAAFLGSPRAPPGVRLRERLSETPRTVSRARRTANVLEAKL